MTPEAVGQEKMLSNLCENYRKIKSQTYFIKFKRPYFSFTYITDTLCHNG